MYVCKYVCMYVYMHFFVGSAFESSHCSRVLHQRVDSRVDEQFIGLVNEEVTHSGLCFFCRAARDPLLAAAATPLDNGLRRDSLPDQPPIY